jgi:hypothetical protein
MVLTVSFVLSPVTGFVATVAGGIFPAQLDASTGASGPHDFAVRYRAPFVKAFPASTASRPTFVTIASAPPAGAGRRD